MTARTYSGERVEDEMNVLPFLMQRGSRAKRVPVASSEVGVGVAAASIAVARKKRAESLNCMLALWL